MPKYPKYAIKLCFFITRVMKRICCISFGMFSYETKKKKTKNAARTDYNNTSYCFIIHIVIF